LRRAATPEKQEENAPKSPENKKGSSNEQNHKYQNYSGDTSQPVLARGPTVDEHVIEQARLNRRFA
jgi:hypothetical protein